MSDDLRDVYGAIDPAEVEDRGDWDPALEPEGLAPETAPDGREYTVAAWDGGVSDIRPDLDVFDLTAGAPAVLLYVSTQGGVQVHEGRLTADATGRKVSIEDDDGTVRTAKAADMKGRSDAVQNDAGTHLGTMLDVRLTRPWDVLAKHYGLPEGVEEVYEFLLRYDDGSEEHVSYHSTREAANEARQSWRYTGDGQKPEGVAVRKVDADDLTDDSDDDSDDEDDDSDDDSARTDGGEDYRPSFTQLARNHDVTGVAVEHDQLGEGEARTNGDGGTVLVSFGNPYGDTVGTSSSVNVSELSVDWDYYDDHPEHAVEAVEEYLPADDEDDDEDDDSDDESGRTDGGSEVGIITGRKVPEDELTPDDLRLTDTIVGTVHCYEEGDDVALCGHPSTRGEDTEPAEGATWRAVGCDNCQRALLGRYRSPDEAWRLAGELDEHDRISVETADGTHIDGVVTSPADDLEPGSLGSRYVTFTTEPETVGHLRDLGTEYSLRVYEGETPTLTVVDVLEQLDENPEREVENINRIGRYDPLADEDPEAREALLHAVEQYAAEQQRLAEQATDDHQHLWSVNYATVMSDAAYRLRKDDWPVAHVRQKLLAKLEANEGRVADIYESDEHDNDDHAKASGKRSGREALLRTLDHYGFDGTEGDQ
ncbi:VP18 [Haloarcula hispanica icosahedral virus 2]|uniref:VP18 n=1 Tax=Haloarcula hispanica icosahedral virus 2 TaxID=1154689 RepID=H9AZZ8_9VIRU|nr:VP18 [Haloarcula hispanica icosahedral virus 2]AFD02323.1 VP18 [Haloarcula hispanica icosahedral virus 2]